MSDFDL